MARYYYLLVFFDEIKAAEKCASQLQQEAFFLESGEVFRCKTDIFKTNNNLFWVFCEPVGVNVTFASNPWVKDANQLDDIANRLYQALKGVRDFICALAGWEVADMFLPDGTCNYNDVRILPAEFTDGKANWDGLVISEILWDKIGRSTFYQPFCKGYVWRPYRTLSVSGW